MSDVRRVLGAVQGQVHARPGSLERVLDRHRRRQAKRRFREGAAAVGTVAIALAIVVVLPLVRRGITPASPLIGSTNVGRLAPAWATDVAGAGSSAPVVADGVVYVTSAAGELHAMDAATGETRWIGSTEVGSPTNPVVSGENAFVHVGGSVYAFNTMCDAGGQTCEPLWRAATGGGNLAPPVVADGVAYVVAAPGGLYAFPVSCQEASCAPLWVAADPESHVAHPPAVDDGVVWDSSSHSLRAFPADCGSSGTICAPVADDIRPGAGDLTSAPAVADGVVYVGASDGAVYALPTGCASGDTCRPLWQGQTGGSIVAAPAVTADRVYVGSNDGNLYAFSTTCGTSGETCDPVWVGRTGDPIRQAPVVANGIVYAASTNGTLYAYPESCAPAAACEPILQERIGSLPLAPAMWDDRVLYTLSAEGNLRAYTIDGTSASG